MNTEGLLDLARAGQFDFVDLRYALFPGRWHHHTLPANLMDENVLNGGAVFVRSDEAGELHLRPAAQTAFVDPFLQHPTIAVTCDVIDAAGAVHADDVRHLAIKAAERLAAHENLAWLRFGATLEFFVFDQASFEQGVNRAHYRVESREGVWRRGTSDADSLGMQKRAGQDGGALPPTDGLHNLRAEMAAALDACGVGVGRHGPGPATGGHEQIALRPSGLLELADALSTAKYVIRNVAARHGKVASFMPQPLSGEPGSGMPIVLAMDAGAATRLVEEQGRLSAVGQGLLWGIRAHAPALAALLTPTTNSFRRLAGQVARGAADGAAETVSVAPISVAAERGELTCLLSDPSSVPHIALASLGQALLDGIENREAPSADAGGGRVTIASRLEGALEAVRADRAFLESGGVFPVGLVERWVRYKLAREVAAVGERPHPYEFCLYFDA